MRNPLTLAETDGLLDGFQSFLVALRDQVVAFGKPVAYVHGDSHYFRVDKPFLDSQGQRLENFTRVETFGDHQENGTNDVNWLKVLSIRAAGKCSPTNSRLFPETASPCLRLDSVVCRTIRPRPSRGLWFFRMACLEPRCCSNLERSHASNPVCSYDGSVAA